jgi:AAA+ ATPase superfamily predicted ATPase
MTKILGRQDEITLLKEILYSLSPQFLAIYGRRRVGKTYLIRNYFSAKEEVVFFDATGLKSASMKDQLANFTDRVGEIFYNGVKLLPDKNWRSMFKTLTDAFKTISQDKKIVIFLDEFPWMATNKSGLLQSLDYFWNQYWSKDNRVKLIICGSSASWILDKIINNKGGLHNRITASILLEAFKLKDTKQFLEAQGLNITNQQLVDLYMVTGGIPYYLTKFKKGLSVAQNIEQIAFRKNAFLLNEFDNLFSSLFDQSDIYVDIIRYITKNKSGVSQVEICKQVKDISTGGQATKKLRALEDTGFIKSFTPYTHNKKGIYYRVIDEFTLFYLKWIEPIKQTLFSTGVASHYWENQMQTQDWAIWSGYALESVCYKHLLQISNSLRINPTSVPNAWRYIPKKNSEDKGAQIDLLFDRPDNAITLCEIKYSNKPFTIDKEYADTLKRKIAVFQKQTKTKKQIFFSLIAANGVINNYYADSIISEIVTLNDLII